ncbi:hypothetical protein F0919_03315 [Taibaiella lutea]|uniref:DUF4138 domain-containing protein n=1 Tax=Taibaiella lutea TaxID=2608001 RepID=A0A5M6CNU8_9BACT|nr:hypothetical protein [Taibaiella lutea]KAA5536713.1 hypothetical protein F0919_03315 [Taibaiella lutea]
MSFKKITFLFLCCCLSSFLTQAQKLLSEGTITYKITISGKIPTPANEPSVTETKSGTVSIRIKGDNIRQDIKLEDGYSHAQISNYATGKEIILQSINELKYAIELNIKDKETQNASYYKAALTLNKEKKTFAGFDAVSALLTYKNGTTFSLFIVPDYYISYPAIFDRFPDIKAIPASYDLLMTNGFTMHFELTSLNEVPVENAAFRVPVGYRIIGQKEYEKLLR